MTSWTYPLIVAQYNRGDRSPLGSEHWALVLFETHDRVHTFQLLGNKDTYGYQPGYHYRFTHSQSYRGGCLVGEVRSDKVSWVREKLYHVPIIRGDETRFNCQIFVIEALRLLKYENQNGVVIREVSMGNIRRELENERERWESADATVDERLFP